MIKKKIITPWSHRIMKAFTEIYENVMIYKNMVYWERKEKNLMFCSVIERKKKLALL